MSHLQLFDTGVKIIARTHMAPLPGQTVFPGMTGEITDRDEITKRHKIRWENGRELWATSDQVKLDPAFAPKEEPQLVEEKSE